MKSKITKLLKILSIIFSSLIAVTGSVIGAVSAINEEEQKASQVEELDGKDNCHEIKEGKNFYISSKIC